MSNHTSSDASLGMATYRAAQTGETVTIHAQGEHPTPGFKVFFEQSPIRIFPPQFVLREVPPTGIVTKVITPFETQTSFTAAEPVEQVIVHDRNGRHEVPVEQVPLVATRTRSGGFIGVRQTLNVYADGTLQFRDDRSDTLETRKVDEHQLRPLQRALARPEWQTIKPAFGQPISDGFTLSISGGGKHTVIAEPPTTPVQLPAILQEVVGHLEALWPSDGSQAKLGAEEGARPAYDLPPGLFKHWVHAHEEDIAGVEVYRLQGVPLPPAFGRTGFEIKPSGEFIQHEPGPADEPQRVPGRWQLQVELDDGRSFSLSIVAVEADVLKVRREDARQQTNQLPVAEQSHD